MKQIILLLIIGVVLIGCANLYRTPTTYIVTGTITMVNDCTGNDADNPATVLVIARLKYAESAFPFRTSQDVRMIPIGDGVTTQGTYRIVSQGKYGKAEKWTLIFPDSCKYISCDDGKCENGASIAPMPIPPGGTLNYDYRYSCSCRE